MHVWAYETVASSPICLRKVHAAYSSASLHRGFPANVCILGCKRYTWRLQTLYLTDANVIPGGRIYLPCRTHVRAGAVTRTCRNGCKYLRLNLDQIGSADALHCRTGCSALQDGLHCTAGRVAVHCVENHSFSPSLTDYVMSSEMRVSSRVHAYVYI